MPQEVLTFGTFNTCVNAFIKLNCDGTPDNTVDPIIFCGLQEVTIRETVNEVDAVEVEGQQSGRNCLEKSGSTTRGDCYVDLTTCGVESPLLFNWMQMYDLVVDADGEICGYRPFDSETSCDICSKVGTAACAHNLAIISIREAWCGKNPHPDFPYIAIIHPSVVFEPQEQEITYGSGFNSSRSFSAKMKSNPNFFDPYGIVTADLPAVSKYEARKLQCPEGSLVEQLVGKACSCDFCGEVAAA